MGPNDHIGAKSWNFNAPQHGNFTQISYRHAKKLCAQLCVRVFRWRSLDPPESFGKSLLIMCARKRVSAFYAFEKLCKNISISVNSDETFPMYCKLLLTCSLKPNMTSVVQQSRSNETDSLSPTQSTFSPTVSFETEALHNRHRFVPFCDSHKLCCVIEKLYCFDGSIYQYRWSDGSSLRWLQCKNCVQTLQNRMMFV